MKPALTLEAFADWCATKPSDERYDYWNTKGCACGQYAKLTGVKNWNDVPNPFWSAANAHAYEAFSGGSRFRTFGALTARLRSAAEAR